MWPSHKGRPGNFIQSRPEPTAPPAESFLQNRPEPTAPPAESFRQEPKDREPLISLKSLFGSDPSSQ
ncbi:hypothetical protein DSJ58_09120 [Mycobacterium tuberculosis]|nr:hypothetical protein DSJ58_09120 [Mycobacterium tuberculosis]